MLEVAGFKADMRKIMVTLFKHNPGAQKLFRDGLRYEKDDTSPKEEGKYDYEVWQLLSSHHLLKGHSLAKVSNIWPFYGSRDLFVEITLLKSLTYLYMKLQQKIVRSSCYSWWTPDPVKVQQEKACQGGEGADPSRKCQKNVGSSGSSQGWGSWGLQKKLLLKT